MGWNVIEVRQADLRNKQASIVFAASRRGETGEGSGRILVSLRRVLHDAVGWKSGDPVGLLIGTDDHAGRIRLSRNAAKPIAKVRVVGRGGFCVDFGFIPQLAAAKGLPKERCEAERIDADTIEIVLPGNWPKPGAASAPLAATPMAKSAPAAPKPVATDPKPAATAAPPPPPALDPVEPDEDSIGTEDWGDMRPAPSRLVNYHGVTIDFDADDESIVFRDKQVEVSSEHARFLAALAASMPQAVARSQLERRLWTGSPPQNADALFDAACVQLTKPLRQMGLGLQKTKASLGLAILAPAEVTR